LVEAAEKLQESCLEGQACSYIEVDERCSFIDKESKCWIWVALDSSFRKILGYVFRSHPIGTDRKLLNIQGLIQAGYSTDYLRTYEYFILPSVTYQGKQLTTKIESLNC